TATYGGDAAFSGDTDTENHTVNPAAPAGTTTTITSDDPDPSAAGATITVNFTVTSSGGTPTGNVLVTDPQGGSCSASVAAGSCQYTPGGTGTRTITATYEGSAGFAGSSDTEDHTVSPAPPSNTAPTANPDAYTARAGVQRTVGQDEDLLNNDFDPDAGDVLAAEIVQGPSRGVIVAFDPSGTFDYTPNGDQAGNTDTFTYRVRDLAGAVSNTTTVTITITP
ncbi:MAG TPA: Ig-like domain repeat protein, partial [Gemmatimonadales bacterium]